ncbi:MAG: hypothetical protein Q7U16_14495 [Agitococcus sp.]|nr:hypothetical protein [Agitococcus sp.]
MITPTPRPTSKYIPIIKWQMWEQRALKHLAIDITPNVLPCIEARFADQQAQLAEKLASTWTQPIIVDFANPNGYLSGSRQSALNNFLIEAKTKGISVIPALNPEDASAIASAGLLGQMAACGEVALRIRLGQYNIPQQTIDACKVAGSELSSQKAKVRLLIDFQETPSSWTPAELQSLAASVKQLCALPFTEIHFASGAFPASLESVKAGMQFIRQDWKLWCDLQGSLTGHSIGYSDYGVLSPSWSETTLIRRSNSTHLKYTSNDHWLVLRTGGKTRAELIALSTLLIHNHSHLFKGASYSYGDKIIADRVNPAVSLKNKCCGNCNITDAWNHHITFVVKEHY